jgi:hypothetical protein
MAFMVTFPLGFPALLLRSIKTESLASSCCLVIASLTYGKIIVRELNNISKAFMMKILSIFVLFAKKLC